MVVGKLRGGADLMIPGLARGPPFPAAATKGSIVAVASLERPSVPLFVGVCEVDIDKLDHVQGQHGRAVRGFHWLGDELWEWSAIGKPGATVPDNIDGWDVEKSEDDHVLEDGVEALNVSGDEGGVKLNEGKPSDQNEEDDIPQEYDQLPGEATRDEGTTFTTKGTTVMSGLEARCSQFT